MENRENKWNQKFSDKINILDDFLDKLNKIKTQIVNIKKNERWAITADTTDIKKIVRWSLYAINSI